MIPLNASGSDGGDDGAEFRECCFCENCIMHAEPKTSLLTLLPALRAFGFCLVQDLKQADELVCSTLIEIWSGRFKKNRLDFKVTAFRALYRQFVMQGSRETIPIMNFERRPILSGDDAFVSRFVRLPRTERVAVSLTEVWSFSLEETAWICDCDRETILCRLTMARRHLGGSSSRLTIGKSATNVAGQHTSEQASWSIDRETRANACSIFE
ncbi:hypothetical protein [Chelativorans sp. Marseille-P2723]|uniref:hypothetical protein n=1 Tax=Chelativorans sp. Marseille-P2723 TaxID=2709133 RepID=UPI00156EAD19|nr:hypothetical protein [Chelativorans sp. Marseille-P2723]